MELTTVIKQMSEATTLNAGQKNRLSEATSLNDRDIKRLTECLTLLIEKAHLDLDTLDLIVTCHQIKQTMSECIVTQSPKLSSNPMPEHHVKMLMIHAFDTVKQENDRLNAFKNEINILSESLKKRSASASPCLLSTTATTITSFNV